MPATGRTAISSACILLNVLSAGSLFCFPLWGPALTKRLGLSMAETNGVATGAILGQYLTGALFGALVDAKGPGFTSRCAAVLLGLGYGLMAVSLNRMAGKWLLLACYYVLSGAGTSASYFAAVSTAVKTFPQHAGLAIGVPSSVFGLAPLLMSWVGSTFFQVNQELDAVAFLAFLALTASLCNLLSSFFLRDPETLAFLESDAANDSLEESQPLLAHRSHNEHNEDKQNPLRTYIADPQSWIFGLAFLLSAGASEGVQASLGNIVEAVMSVHTQKDTTGRPWPSDSALQARTRHVQIFALCNTLARLGAGALSDAICPIQGSHPSRKVSRLWIYASSSFQLCIALSWAAFRLNSVGSLYAVSIPVGINYGVAFSMTPTIIANKWGLTHFGLHFGLSVILCAFGGILFTVCFSSLMCKASLIPAQEAYGWLSDAASSHSICHGTQCFRACFLLMAASLACTTVISVALSFRRGWLGRI